MDFGEAIVALKNGARVARSGWNGKDMYIELQVPDAHSKMSLPYIFMRTADRKLVPWLASQTDVLSEDWSIHRSSLKTPLLGTPLHYVSMETLQEGDVISYAVLGSFRSGRIEHVHADRARFAVRSTTPSDNLDLVDDVQIREVISLKPRPQR